MFRNDTTLNTAQAESNGISERVRLAAEKLYHHITACDYKPGDRFLKAEEAATLVGESVMTVQRAMKFLSDQDVLERRPKAGTFVGNNVGHQQSATSSNVIFFLPEQCLRENSMPQTCWDQILGMREVLPALVPQFSFLGDQNVGSVEHHVKQVADRGQLTGVVLVLPSRALRVFFNNSGIPTVVDGGVEPDLKNLYWITWDQVHTGRLLAQYLLQRGHTRMATIMRDVWSIGEHQLHDGITEAISEAGLAANALRVRSTPSEHSAISTLVRHILHDEQEHATGFICRTEFQAECVTGVAEQLGLDDRIEAVICNPPAQSSHSPYMSVIPEVDTVETGRIAARFLKNALSGTESEEHGRLIPVRLRPEH